jgi:hypothetical protein
MEFLGEFFVVYDIDIHQLNLGKFRNIRFSDEIPFKKSDFWHLFSNGCIIIFSFRKRPLPYQIRRDFINGHCIIFSLFFCLVMFYEPKT